MWLAIVCRYYRITSRRTSSELRVRGRLEGKEEIEESRPVNGNRNRAMTSSAFLSFPSAPLTRSLINNALRKVLPSLLVNDTKLDSDKLLQWATYDNIDHESTLASPSTILSSSYIIRKALIRKHFLNRTIKVYVAKNPNSILSTSTPRTWDFEISFADELDELWQDDLYDLSIEMDNNPNQWWILKPGMADRGMGLRVFRTKEELAEILEGLDTASDQSDADGEDLEDADGAMLSQLRHFVVQVSVSTQHWLSSSLAQNYLASPLLFDPVGSGSGHKVSFDTPASETPHQFPQFHLRAYCVASGSLKVFLYNRILALFAANPFQRLSASDGLNAIDLAAHLTNTSQHSAGTDSDPYVKLLDELVGLSIMGGSSRTFTKEDVKEIVSQMKVILDETFRSAVANPVHFMV